MGKFRRGNIDRNKREPRINERIRASTLRLLIEGQAPMIVDRSTALRKAEDLGLDLIEISPNQDPPVCRIIDYGKYKFEQKKRKREQARSQHNVSIKEIKLRPKIAKHDYDLKKRNANAFLQHGDKVKVTVRFRGREAAHPELGMNLIKRMAEDLKEFSVLEVPARQEGRQINMVLAPQPNLRKTNKKEDSAKKEGESAAAKALESKAVKGNTIEGDTIEEDTKSKGAPPLSSEKEQEPEKEKTVEKLGAKKADAKKASAKKPIVKKSKAKKTAKKKSGG